MNTSSSEKTDWKLDNNAKQVLVDCLVWLIKEDRKQNPDRYKNIIVIYND